ncbi:MAG: hypothetical protein QNJ47_21315 [Nostocaceae cyanobacterium]|nr:hypothetical protein [Nostocaceae cyanobacterium]
MAVTYVKILSISNILYVHLMYIQTLCRFYKGGSSMAKQNRQPGSTNSVPNSKSSEEKDLQNFGRRNFEDQERDKSVYRYLLECLTDLDIKEIKEGNSKPNESSIAKQWGQEKNRIFIRRVLRSVLPEYYNEEEKESVKTVPGLTLGKLVEILDGIQKYWANKRLEISKDPGNKVPRILSRTDKIRAFRKFYQLSIEEKERLNIPIHPGETLLQELLDTVTDPVKGLKPEDIINFYKKAQNNYHYLKNLEFNNQRDLQNNSHRDIRQKIITPYVTAILEEHYQGLDSALKTQKTEDLVKKVYREISRIELQCGVKQVKSFLHQTTSAETLLEDSQDFPGSFIEHLTRSIVENEILTDEFPINIKYFEIEKAPPLPLYFKKDNPNGLLNSLLIDGKEGEEEQEDDVMSLQTQFAYKVRVHFYIKIADNYKPEYCGSDHQSFFNKNENKLEFFEDITGIGSPISHIIAIINRVLLWDIPALKEYFPVPRNILRNNEFFGSHSFPHLVWSYNLVNLCKKTDVEKAVAENKIYDQVVGSYEPAYGEYCGFDVVEVAVKAAFHARLRAIKQTGISPLEYLKQLCRRVEEINSLRKAESYLNFYPFSLTAMEGHLNRTIFRDKYRTRNNQFEFSEIEPNQPWSAVAYDAHLTITEGYLKEGLYRIAKRYLDVLKPHIEEARKGNNKFFSDFMFAKYEICQFRYHYLTDLEDSECYQLHSERSSAIRTAINSLNDAEEYLKNLLTKYHALGDSAQSNFHPFFYLLSTIYLHRAKVYIFTSPYTDLPVGHWNGLREPLRLLEKARIYAARDGNSAHYAYWSAKQSWYYLMVAYLLDYEPCHQIFTREECIDWAKRLIKHALICYTNHGNHCFHKIKDHGGRITENNQNRKYYEDYGEIQIQVVPLIQEIKEDCHECEQTYNQDKNVINLDFSILKQPHPDRNNKSIYLFGTHSSILLFAMGMLELCEDIEKENEDELKSKIKKAIRMFTYCSAIAEDGIGEYGDTSQRSCNNGILSLDRIFKDGDDLVRGLYPHRLTHFADLGKIWTATCKSILCVYNSTYDWQEINLLLDTLPNVSKKQILANACGQERYNGHFASHYQKVCEYFKNLQSKTENLDNLIEIRNKIVRDIFKIMRGESDVRP